MIDIPLPQLIEKITASSSLSEEEIKTRIKKKMDELAGLISEEGAAHIVANELSVKIIPTDEELTVDKILAGMRNVTIIGKARQVYEVREFKTERRSGKVGNFLLTDPTGTMRIVLWNEQADHLKDLKAGDVVKLKGAYARNNQGRVELHVSENGGKIIINPEGVTVDVDIDATVRPEATTKKIKDLSETDQNTQVIATIVQVFEPRYFSVCPECNARVREEQGNNCPTHGAVTPTYNYVMNLYLDDATDSIRCVLWRDQVNALLDKKHDEILAMKDNPALFEPYKTDLLGMIIRVRGRVSQNQTYGKLELVAYELERDVTPEGTAAEQGAEKDSTVNDKPSAVNSQEQQESAVNNQSPTTPAKEEPASTPKEPEPAKEAPTKKPSTEEKKKEDDLFTLEDLEDLEDLD